MFTICVMSTISQSMAQSSQMATLLHDGKITNFYSATAFIEALDAATDGDIISLSSGSFTSKNISKNVSIRGVGYTVQGYNENENPTVFTGDFSINNSKSETDQLTLEGIISNGLITISAPGGFTALKCQFKRIQSYDIADPLEAKFIHCVIDEFSTSNASKAVTLDMINSVIEGKIIASSSTNIQYTNSIVSVDQSIAHSTLTNSILIINKTTTLSNTSLANSCHVINSIIIGCEKSSATGGGNKHLPAGTQVFSDNSFYCLNNDYKEFKGIDGTEVGIHGGNMPFTPITSRPRITRFDVGGKTTLDGKLSVDIEVRGEE